MNLKTRFPHASNDFLKINHQAESSESQSTASDALVGTVKGKKEGLHRVTLRYRIYRVYPQDQDNAYGSTKALTDALVLSGLVQNDDPTRIKTILEQEKVEHFAQERIELTITYP